MPNPDRRGFLLGATGSAALASLLPSIARAAATPASRVHGSIQDVQHIVILMQENRSFDHYFGTMRGVRGFGDRHPIPLPGGKSVWSQSDGAKDIPPFHLDTARTDAMQVPGTPHSFSDAQAAWGQGQLKEWPRFKTKYSMGYYRREDIPFQFALAEAFTLADSYHCSITTGTDPNRIVFWSGSAQEPISRDQGVPGVEGNSEPNNLRCWVKGEMPEPGYTYQGSALTWPTIPDVLEAAGIDWKFYQDPNNNWTGAMHGGLAFDSFRTAKPGSPLYEKGMRHWSLEQLEADVKAGTLPAVSWILPPRIYSEHPSASTPIQGAEFTARVLDALTANPEVWSKTVFFLTFDENDGQFDHLAPPSVPSYRADGTLAGKSTVDVKGLYFNDDQGKYLHPDDKISGAVRPWGLGPRVPLYIVSPWSKGGWVNSEVADHTSVGQFIEKRFGVTIPAISAWHRSVCSDLVSAFDFGGPSDAEFPALPDVSGSSAALLDHLQRPRIQPPSTPQPLFQEPGVRPSRALPYMLEVGAGVSRNGVTLNFVNTGAAGAVFQVYDKLHLDRIPQRYTVEAGKALDDQWALTGEDGGYDLWVLGPNGFLRSFKGQASSVNAGLRLDVRQNKADASLTVTMHNKSRTPAVIQIEDAYRKEEDVVQVVLRPGSQRTHTWRLQDYGSWYDLVFVADGGFERRLAGRLETGMDSMSDPLMGSETRPA
ncbi:phosphocholine-specific phospholipase C [Brevundimonas diminuta]